MTAAERIKFIHRQLFRYKSFNEEIAAYTLKAFRQNAKADPAGVRGAFRSDPTARGGIMLAELPEPLEKKKQWCAAIEDAWAECIMEDAGDKLGLAHLLESFFCLTGEPRKEEDNKEAVKEICNECGISESTFYNRRDKITDIVQYHAAKRGLV